MNNTLKALLCGIDEIKFFFLISSLLFCASPLLSQQPFFYKIDSDFGFPSDEVYEVVQDSFGYIWIGCDAGLVRYDGVEFKNYQHQLQSGRSISHIKIDNDQRVWCQNFSGQIFYAFGDSLYLFGDFADRTRSFPAFDIGKENNHLWVATDSTIELFDMPTRRLIKNYNKITNRLKLSESISLKLYENSVFVASARNDIQQLDIVSQLQQRLDVDSFYYYSSKKLYEIDEDLIGFFINKERSAYQFFRIKEEKIEVINTVSKEFSGHQIYHITKLGQYYAIGTSDGLKFTNERFEIIDSWFPNEKISYILEDREGNIWLTSLQNGIYVIPSRELETFDNDFFPESNITALDIRNNELVIGTYSGYIIYLNPETNAYKIHSEKNLSRYRPIKDFHTYKNQWLIGGGGIIVIDEDQQETELAQVNVRAITVMEDTVFCANVISVSKGALKGDRFFGIKNKSGRAITKHPTQNIIYYAIDNGFFKYENGKSTELFYLDQKIYPTDFAWQEDTLWLSSITNGVFLFLNDECISNIPQGSKLPGNNLRQIYRYKSKMLLAADIGVISMDISTKKFTVFDASDGFGKKEINALEVLNDVLYVGTSRGLVRFPLSMNAQNEVRPNIAITDVRINDERLDPTKSSTLPYFKNNLAIKFKTALMRSRGDFHYEYRLIGFDENWKKTSSSNAEISYNALPSGTFQFEVKSVNEDGVSSFVRTFQFTITRPIWERWWFILLVAIFIFAISYWLVQRRMKGIQRQVRFENEMKSSQLTALKAQMNPHFLYNALNSIQDLILRKDVRNANRYLTKFSLLMRQVLEASNDMSISLTQEIRILELYLDLEKLRFGDEFEYRLQLPEDIDFDALQIPSMIIQPFVENAIKHGLLHKTNGIKRVSIDFEIEKIITCTIIDNGVGRGYSTKIKNRRNAQSTSFATSATQKRLDILNQTHDQKIGLEIIDLQENGEATGTKIILQIPIWE